MGNNRDIHPGMNVRGKSMTYLEIQKDLFEVPGNYYLAHCINGNYTLGAGIAKIFRDKMNMQDRLHSEYPVKDGEQDKYIGKALLIGNVFNL